mgnify:CR=1 FL=1
MQLCIDNVDGIGHGEPQAISRLFDALLESGYCMLDFGESRPASGAEHHTSHYWEMKLLREGRPAILHGAKTGVGTILGAQLYKQVRELSRHEVEDLLEASTMPSRDAEIATIRDIYGQLSDEVVHTQKSFLDLTPEQVAADPASLTGACLLYTSDAADERSSVELGGRRIITKKKKKGYMTN